MSYAEPRNTHGLFMARLYVALFGLVTAVFLLPPLIRPTLLEGITWDEHLGFLSLIVLPWVLYFGTFGKGVHAEILQSRPLQIRNEGLLFPVAWRKSQDRVVPWNVVVAVGTDYGPSQYKYRLFWHLWLVLADGTKLERPYLAGDNHDDVIRGALAHLQQRLEVVEGSAVFAMIGRKPPSERVILSLRILSVATAVAVVVFVALSLLLGFIRTFSAVGWTTLSVSGFSLPLWLRSVDLMGFRDLAAQPREPG